METEDDFAMPTQEEAQERRQANIVALQNNELRLQRKSLVQGLSASNCEAVLKQPFRCPLKGTTGFSDELKRRLKARKFVPWGNGKHDNVFRPKFTPPSAHTVQEVVAPAQPAVPAEELAGIEDLCLWAPPEGIGKDRVVVDPMLTKSLRPHQREGVQFMFECVAGLRQEGRHGCILADDMGLGKTFQSITLLWTLLNEGHALLGGKPLAKRVIIVCPTSLVGTWDEEINKWLQGRLQTLPLQESSREQVILNIKQFLAPQNFFKVLIVSYETFRLHSLQFAAPHSCDLLICDEAHRLKNSDTLINKALDSLPCKKRVLLSGTPLQNNLSEFFAMCNFCNPGVLGTPAEFRRMYEGPIVAGREPDATDEQNIYGQERSKELSTIVNDFILRRTNDLLSAHLPPKVVITMCCRLTDLQQLLYMHFAASSATRNLIKENKQVKDARVLSFITALKKLCNHPKLIYDAVHSKAQKVPDGFQGCADYFQPGMFDNTRGTLPPGWEQQSGKFAVLAHMLHLLRMHTQDRIVIVSNYTQTLDLVATLCRERNYPFLRLDGGTSVTKRQKLVAKFNNPDEQQFVFLLSSRAGGCGLTITGANRLVLFDQSWNPADDAQACARVWRDGQKKRVFVYRMMSAGTIEEKVYQRQLSKNGLASLVNQSAGNDSNLVSTEELRDLFTLRTDTMSDTYDSMYRTRGNGEGASPRDPSGGGGGLNREEDGQPAVVFREQMEDASEQDLQQWGWHSSTRTVPDAVTQAIGDEHVSFCFTCKVAGKPVEDDKPFPTTIHSAPTAPNVPMRRGRVLAPHTAHASMPFVCHSHGGGGSSGGGGHGHGGHGGQHAAAHGTAALPQQHSKKTATTNHPKIQQKRSRGAPPAVTAPPAAGIQATTDTDSTAPPFAPPVHKTGSPMVPVAPDDNHGDAIMNSHHYHAAPTGCTTAVLECDHGMATGATGGHGHAYIPPPRNHAYIPPPPSGLAEHTNARMSDMHASPVLVPTQAVPQLGGDGGVGRVALQQVSPNLHAAQRLVKSVAAPPMYDSTPPTINTKRQRPSAPAAAAARLRLVCIDSDESDDFA